MRINFQGKQVEAKEVEFAIQKEDFNSYQLFNGDIIKVKTIVTEIYEVTGEKNT